jgi:hypothetical protein
MLFEEPPDLEDERKEPDEQGFFGSIDSVAAENSSDVHESSENTAAAAADALPTLAVGMDSALLIRGTQQPARQKPALAAPNCQPATRKGDQLEQVQFEQLLQTSQSNDHINLEPFAFDDVVKEIEQPYVSTLALHQAENGEEQGEADVPAVLATADEELALKRDYYGCLRKRRLKGMAKKTPYRGISWTGSGWRTKFFGNQPSPSFPYDCPREAALAYDHHLRDTKHPKYEMLRNFSDDGSVFENTWGYPNAEILLIFETYYPAAVAQREVAALLAIMLPFHQQKNQGRARNKLARRGKRTATAPAPACRPKRQKAASATGKGDQLEQVQFEQVLQTSQFDDGHLNISIQCEQDEPLSTDTSQFAEPPEELEDDQALFVFFSALFENDEEQGEPISTDTSQSDHDDFNTDTFFV